MPGNNQHGGTSRKGERIQIRSGRASKAIGDPKEKLMQGTSLQQGANVSKRPASSHGAARTSATTKKASAPKNTRNAAKTSKSAKKTSTSKAARSVPVIARNPPGETGDVRFIQWVNEWWNALESHHKQGIFSACLLILSLLLFGSLTVFQTAPILNGIHDFFLVLFGWSAYFLAVGLVVFALAHLVEGIRRQQLVRLSFVAGLVCIWLLLLMESALIVGRGNVGVLGALLVIPFLGWSPGVDQVIVLGLLLITCIVTFRLTFGHVLLATRYVKRLFADPALSTNLSGGKTGRNRNTPAQRRLAPFLGQRPQYSRYSAVGSPNGNDEADDEAFEAQGTRMLAQGQRQVQLPEDDELDIEVELEDDDDPLNDINIHKQRVGLISRASRAVRALDPEEHQQAVRGVRQQQLPLEQQKSAGTERDKMPSYPPGKMIINAPIEMEPLAPNPRLLAQDVQSPRGFPGQPASTSQAQTRSAKGRTKKQSAITPAASAIPEVALPYQSLWKLPGTSLLNSPDTVKLQIYADDTGELAKIIQNTLRSFRVEAEVRPADISIGPTVIRFGIRPTGRPEMRKDDKTGKMEVVTDVAGNIVYEMRTRVSRIMALQNDLALVLEAKTIRMEAPVPGRPYVGVEIPNKNSRLVTLREVLESREYQTAQARSKLAIGLGKDVAGQVRVSDLAKMPHLLIAGATGAGKCLAYGEPVFLADGRIIKVQELVGQTVQVIGVTDTKTMKQTPVAANFTENGVQEVFEIELDNGIVLRRTGEHPLWAARLNENQHVGRQFDGKAARRTRAIDAGWVQAKNLRVCGNRPNFNGHIILCPLTLHQQATVSRSDADVILCAALLAEGGLNQYDYLNYRRTPRFTSADPLMVELVATAAKEYGCKLVLSQNKSQDSVDYYISRTTVKKGEGNPISKLVHDWGIDCLATQKTIPAWVFQLPDEQITLFLRVFIDCDGWFSVRDHRSSVSISLANPILIQQIGQLALRLGITGTYTQKENGFAGAWTWATCMVSEWQERVGSLVKEEKLVCAVAEQAKSRESAATKWTAWRQARPLTDQKFADCPQGYEWRKIVAIRRSTAPTVNIEVHSDNHAFVGYAVEHNSVCLNTIIASILIQATPDDVRLLMVDPKMVELNMYNGIPHLLSPVVIEVDKVVSLLKNAIHEMERRYRLFSQLGVRNLDGYRKMRQEKLAQNDNALGNLPAIVIIIDELADLMMAAAEEVEGMICRLAQLARATGIHLIVATQRPSVDVITGLIKANIPTRISFMVSSAVDSRTIIDMGGAERLLGRGDMLYLPADAGRPERVQGAFLSDDEAQALAEYWRHQLSTFDVEPSGDPTQVETKPIVEPGWELKEDATDDPELEDDLLDKAEEVVREYGRASISLLQRRLRIGYSRAARLIDLLEDRGIIGQSESGGRAREVYGNGNGGNGRGDHYDGGDRHSIADEVADIVAEEQERNDFLREQAARFQQQPRAGNASRAHDDNDG